MTSDETKDLLQRIEELRAVLLKLAAEKGTVDPEVIKASRDLDEALVRYQRLIARKGQGS